MLTHGNCHLGYELSHEAGVIGGHKNAAVVEKRGTNTGKRFAHIATQISQVNSYLVWENVPSGLTH